VAATSLLLSGCGSKATESDSANAASCVDTSGPTIKVGALNSLSGTMAISEVTVRHAIDLAVEQINAAGGVMGKQIQLVGEDGASEPTVFAMGALLEVTLIQRMYARPLDTLLVTFGVGLILQQVARDIFGAPAVNVIAPSWLSGGVEILGAVVPKSRIFILLLAVVCVAVLATVLKVSPMGRRIRAVVQNRDLAETSGISSRKTDITTFFIGSGLAAVAGVALTLIGSTSPTIGQSYLIDAFLVVVVGGLGQIKGTVIAAFALGFLNSFIEYNTTASLAKVIVFVIIVIFLQVRPQGLFTVRTRSLA